MSTLARPIPQKFYRVAYQRFEEAEVLLCGKGISMVMILHEPDDAVERLAAALKVYEQSHEAAACFVYRYNPAAIRVKIIDPTFHGRFKGERHDYVWGFLQGVSEDILAQISVLPCLELGESAPLDVEFHGPTRSYI